MDWLTQYWPYLLAVLLIGLLVVRLVTMLPRFRQPTRHSGERTIRVVGVGGAGGNAINHMIKAKQRGVEYVAVNTDAQVLDESLAMRRVQIGARLTQGLGAGGDATIGREAAEEDVDELARMVAGADLVFIAAGLGGGTGSGAAPVIAAKARESGALTVGVVTKPFSFEGAGRRHVAEEAEAELKAHVDTLLLIENERVMDLVGEDTSMLEAFRVVNEVLARTVRAIVDVMTVPGLINLDFADVRAVMRDGGTATTGIGWASGPDRAVEAARAAVTNPLLDHDISGAGAILLNVAGASSMSMREVTRAADEIRNAADPEASIIFGTIFDDHLGDELRVTVIATRFSDRTLDRPAVAVPAAAVPPTTEAPVATPTLEPTAVVSQPLEEPVSAPAAAIAPAAAVASWYEPTAEPDATSEPVAYEADEADEPSPEPVGFHVAPEDEPAPSAPWLASSAPTRTEAPEVPAASEQPQSSSVATVLAALAEEPAPAYEQREAPTPTFVLPEEPEAAASFEEPAPAPELPQGLAEILKDETEPHAEPAQPGAYLPPADEPTAAAPRVNGPSPAPAAQRHDPARTPTSALVGRFWSRIGKSQR